MFCKNCGMELREEVKFCSRCGQGRAGASDSAGIAPGVTKGRAVLPETPSWPFGEGIEQVGPTGPSRNAGTPLTAEERFARGPKIPASRLGVELPLSNQQVGPQTMANGRMPMESLPAPRRESNSGIWLAAVLILAIVGGGFFLYRAYAPVPDATIVKDIKAAYSKNPSSTLAGLMVSCNSGYVALIGSVPTEADRAQAIEIAKSQRGVKQVVAAPVVGNIVDVGQPIPTSIPTPGTVPVPSGDGGNPVASLTPPQDESQAGNPTAQVVAAGPPIIVQAVIREGGTSLELTPGQKYIFGMATGGALPSEGFSTGQSAQVVNQSHRLAAALAFGDSNANEFSTQTWNHVIGGVSVGGRWSDVKTYYASNIRQGASIAAASFTLPRQALVVVIALAGGQDQVSVHGIPSLAVDGSSTSSNHAMPMMVGHATLAPGSYVVSMTSAGLPAQDAECMADLLGVFVFSYE